MLSESSTPYLLLVLGTYMRDLNGHQLLNNLENFNHILIYMLLFPRHGRDVECLQERVAKGLGTVILGARQNFSQMLAQGSADLVVWDVCGKDGGGGRGEGLVTYS